MLNHVPIEKDALTAVFSRVRNKQRRGELSEIRGTSLRAVFPEAKLGEMLRIESSEDSECFAEVVGFSQHHCQLSALSSTRGLKNGAVIHSLAQDFGFYAGTHLLGKTLNAFAKPLDQKPLQTCTAASWRSPYSQAPAPEDLRASPKQLRTGIFSIDHFTPLAHGQRIGLFAEPGVGKSSLLEQINAHCAAEVKVIALIGERGREIEEAMRTMSAENTVIVAASSSEPAAVRALAADTAFAIAEHFRDQGKEVLLQIDSLSRLFRAYRDIGLSGGESPSRRGYPASAFARLPTLLERAGNTTHGSITAIFTVLLSDELEQDPLVDEVKGLLDGHLLLSKQLAATGKYPAIDIATSLSRLESSLVSKEQGSCLRRLRAFHIQHLENKSLQKLGVTQDKQYHEDEEKHQRLFELLYETAAGADGNWEGLIALVRELS